MTAGLTLAAVAPAGASAPAKDNSKICKLLSGITIDSASTTNGKANARKYAKALKKAAKKASGDIKKTLKTLAKYYTAVANEDTSALQDQAEAFGKATAAYATYLTTACLSDALDSIPDISIPGG
jgi:hypothetical protein